ncbi:hypothetical protein JW977_01780 [Candidatus Falkowbacteria bacterium]|nr:hypothetical protein [Candidatus Falkowbacteria bacterium]
MLISVHATIGAVIGEKIHYSLFAFALAFLSHFVLDIIPHGDKALIKAYRNDFKNKAMLYLIIFDVISTVILLGLMFYLRKLTYSPAVLWGIIGGILPDVMVAIHEITHKQFHRAHKAHDWAHEKLKWSLPLNLALVYQIIILYLLLRN